MNDEMKRFPHRETLAGLRAAFPAVPYSSFVLKAASSMGIPIEEEPEVDYGGLSNEALIGILEQRLKEGSNAVRQAKAQKNGDDDEGEGQVARQSEPKSPGGGGAVVRFPDRRQRMIEDAQEVPTAAAQPNPADDADGADE